MTALLGGLPLAPIEPTFPPIAEACFGALLLDESLRMPGLFLEDPLLDDKVVALLEQFDRGNAPPLQSRSPLLVALLFKRWLATLDFPIFGPVPGELLLVAHQQPTPQLTLDQFRALVASLGPVPYHLLRRLTALLRAYVKENEGKPGSSPNLLLELGEQFAPLVFWMPVRDPLRLRPTNEQLGGVPPGHVLVQVNIPPLGFSTRQPLPLNVTVQRLRAQMLAVAGAPSAVGWHMWMAPPSPVEMLDYCTLRQYSVQNTDVIIINNEEMPDKPLYAAAASSILRCIVKNYVVFYPPLEGASVAPPLQRRASMTPNMMATADAPMAGGVAAPPMLQRRSTVSNVNDPPIGTYMAPSLDIFRAPVAAAPAGAPGGMMLPARAAPQKPPSRAGMMRVSGGFGTVGDAPMVRSSTVDLSVPPAVAAVPSPFLTADLSSMPTSAAPAVVLAAAVASPPVPVRDVANRPRAPVPPELEAAQRVAPAPAMQPAMQPAARRVPVAPGPAARRPAVVRDAYQPLADARKRGMLLAASGNAADEDDDDEAGGIPLPAGDQYQDIPSKWAPELATGGGGGGGGAATSALGSPRKEPIMPAGVRRSEATHYGSSSMLQKGVAARNQPAQARPSFAAKPAF